MVILDEDRSVGAPETAARSLIAEVGPGQRVMVQRIHPFGLAIVGQITPVPWATYTPEIDAYLNDGKIGGALDLGVGAVAIGRFRNVNGYCNAHLAFRWGTSPAIPANTAFFALRLPVPVTFGWASGAAMEEEVIGHGFVVITTGADTTGLQHVQVDAPVGAGTHAFILFNGGLTRNSAGNVPAPTTIMGPTSPTNFGWTVGQRLVVKLGYMTG